MRDPNAKGALIDERIRRIFHIRAWGKFNSPKPHLSLMSNSPAPMKRKELEIKLQSLQSLDTPSARLEQYPTPAKIVSDIIFIAKYLGDIDGKSIADLGCGNGVFAIGAHLMGAGKVIGIDVDKKAIEVARENALDLGIGIDLEAMDIGSFDQKVDVVFQNPPFGSQKKHADRPFLEKAMEMADVVYTIHMADTEEFIVKISKSLGFSVDMKTYFRFELRHSQKFHRKERAFIDVVVFRLVRDD